MRNLVRDIGINQNSSERIARLNRELNAKLKLERFLSSDLMSIYNRISRDGRILYADSGELINVSIYKDLIKEALIKQYRRVFKVFPNPLSIDIVNSIKQKTVQQIQIEKEQEDYINDRSELSSQQLVDSTQKRWNDSVKATIALLLLLRQNRQEEDFPISIPETPISGASILDSGDVSVNEPPNIVGIRSEVADRASRDFNGKSRGRSDTAATTETQNSSETNKFIIATILLINLATSAKKDKVWMTILDGRERVSHGLANGQKVHYQDPYIVQGQSLMYPGDIGMGATADNVINCRCASMIILTP